MIALNQTRYHAAISVLSEMLVFAAPSDATMSRFFRSNPNLGGQDRHMIAECVYGILRNKIRLEWVLGGPSNARSLLTAYLVVVERRNLRECGDWFPETEKETFALCKSKKLAEAPMYVRADLPEWVANELIAAGMDDAELLALGAGLQGAAALDLRVNSIKAKREQVAAELLDVGGIETTPTPYSPWGLRVTGKPAINKYRAFSEGRVEVQDEGSQLLGLLTGAKRGQMVVDFCAGAGGKTLLLGAMMNSSGRLYAFDVSEKRLNNFKPRLARSGLSNVNAQLISSENDQKIKRLVGKIDAVLVDAPCSGMGTVRRNPDLKFRQNPASVAELNAMQTSILASASRLVKSAGRLVYATCSLLPSENEAIVDAFLAANPDFKLVDAREIMAAEHVEIELAGPYLKLTPHRHHTDAFFAAVMQRD
ncbi:MAG: RsmB/NOP family class I SAM-dependent RNA methyltransferase [Iodobacter sp.]